MKTILSIFLGVCFLMISSTVFSQQVAEVASPDGQLRLSVLVENGNPMYTVSYNGKNRCWKTPRWD
jgi:hypothetical protein